VLVCNTWLSDGFASQAIKIIWKKKIFFYPGDIDADYDQIR
jgi:hypothetical protein